MASRENGIPDTLSTARIVNHLILARHRFGFGRPTDEFHVVDRWEKRRSGSIFLRVSASSLTTDLVCKVGGDWDPGTGKRLYDALMELGRILGDAGLGEDRTPLALAWMADPEMVVMTHIDGTDVVSILRHAGHEAWSNDARGMKRWMTEAGTMLAAYHNAAPVVDDLQRALREVETLSRRLRLGQAAARQLQILVSRPHRCGAAYGDFGPGNLVGGEDGVVRLLDPPEVSAYAPIHRDLAHFLFETTRQLAGHGFTRTRPTKGWTRRLRRCFLDGYAAAASVAHLTSADHALIYAYEMRRALGMAHKSLRHRPSDAAWAARHATRLRGRILRAIRQSRSQSSV